MPHARKLEGVLWTMGLACAGYLVLLAVQAQALHQRATHLPANGADSAPAVSGAIIGRIDIPQLKLSAAVLEDDQSQSLLHGLGHMRGTAQLGGLGTVALAGHRDTFLRPLRNIAPGMEILASSVTGTYKYVVDSTEIVSPDAVNVLDIRSRPELVFITCYPFNYVGAAPRRFIVHAHLVSVAADAPNQIASHSGPGK